MDFGRIDSQTVSISNLSRMRVTLCLLCVSACLTSPLAAPLAAPRKAAEAKAAPQDEVSVLMYGVLQFSQSFHEFYQSTEAKFARIAESLRSHELALEGLSQDALEAAGREVQIRGALGLLKVRKNTPFLLPTPLSDESDSLYIYVWTNFSLSGQRCKWGSLSS